MVKLVKKYQKSLGTKIYNSEISTRIAKQFTLEQIPNRIQRLFRKILWDKTH
ncbi:MAG: hypothetical protein ACXAC7_15045 [Candidatus Hodarchaeales archaeon]|jgi:hypothetical protein